MLLYPILLIAALALNGYVCHRNQYSFKTFIGLAVISLIMPSIAIAGFTVKTGYDIIKDRRAAAQAAKAEEERISKSQTPEGRIEAINMVADSQIEALKEKAASNMKLYDKLDATIQMINESREAAIDEIISSSNINTTTNSIDFREIGRKKGREASTFADVIAQAKNKMQKTEEVINAQKENEKSNKTTKRRR